MPLGRIFVTGASEVSSNKIASKMHVSYRMHVHSQLIVVLKYIYTRLKSDEQRNIGRPSVRHARHYLSRRSNSASSRAVCFSTALTISRPTMSIACEILISGAHSVAIAGSASLVS